MARYIIAMFAIACALATTAHADDGIWVGYGPVGCYVAVDSLERAECRDTLSMRRDGGTCTFGAVKDGVGYTAHASVRWKGTITLPIAQIPTDRIVFKSKKQPVCFVTEGNGFCTPWGDLLNGGAHCTYCIGQKCYKGTATIRMTRKASSS